MPQKRHVHHRVHHKTHPKRYRIGKGKLIRRSFTLIELMVVIGILVLLLSIVVVAINPGRQFAQARDVKRQSDLVQFSNAIYQNIAENHGTFVVSGNVYKLKLTPVPISNTGADICPGLLPNFLSALPRDPDLNNGDQISECYNSSNPINTAYDTGYQISTDLNGRIILTAPKTEVATSPITIMK